DSGTIQRALNFYLPADVRIISCWQAAPDFHARFSAKWRYYIYRLHKTDKALFRQYGWRPREQVDFTRLNETAELFIRDHEFTAFCAADAVDDHHHCLVHRSSWIELADEYHYHIVANRFLKHMVRMLVGVTIDVSRGRYPAQQIRDLFQTNQKENLVITAPPQGLFLMTVGYGEFPYVDLEQKQTQSFP
ncbi:hypothetical protein KKA08_09620, partial [bacterium]|nr:hypothetical protein [bacterium]